MSVFARLFPNSSIKTKTHVRGFTISAVRKKGCVLKTRPKNSPQWEPKNREVGAPEHFEVVVRHDGTNPLYQGKNGPWKFLLTNTQDEKQGFGMVGHIVYERPKTRFTRVEIVEEYEDFRHAEHLPRPAPAHLVSLKIYTEGDPQSGTTSLGLASRPA